MTPEQAWNCVNGVKTVSRETFERLTVYHDLLIQWQERINLISPATVNQVWERHIADSLQICASVGQASSVVDLGSGAGFPGLVQAIVFADSEKDAEKTSVDLVESNGKKCAFMNAVIRACDLRAGTVETNVHNGRIEDVLPQLDQPDVITARALASLDDLLRLTDPYLANGSIGVFPKGQDHKSEIETAEQKWSFKWERTESRLRDSSVILKISDVRPR